LIVRGVTAPLVVAKHGVLRNLGLEPRDTVPAIWPDAGGALNVMVALAGESNAKPWSSVKPSSDPVAEPDDIVGRNVAMKVPVLALHAETFPTEEYVPDIAGIDADGLPGIAV
jgi:hypothetical protein